MITNYQNAKKATFSPHISFCTGSWIDDISISSSLVACVSNRRLWLFCRQTGRLLFKTQKNEYAIKVFFCPKNCRFLYMITISEIKLIDTKNNTCLWGKVNDLITKGDELNISPKGSFFACGNTVQDPHRLWLFDSKRQTLINKFHIPDFNGRFAISMNENFIAGADSSGFVYLIGIGDQYCCIPKKIKLSNSQIDRLKFSKDGKQILFASRTMEVGACEIDSETVVFFKKAEGLEGTIICLEFGATENEFFLVTDRGEFVVLGPDWETRSFINTACRTGFRMVDVCVLSKKNQQLVIGTTSGHIEFFSTFDQKPFLIPWTGATSHIHLNGMGQLVLSSIAGTPIFWDLQSRAGKHLIVEKKSKWKFCWMEKKQVLVAASFDGELYGFNPIKSPDPIFHNQVQGPIHAIVHSKEGEFLVCAGYPMVFTILGGDGKLVRCKKTKSNELYSLVVDPRGTICTIEGNTPCYLVRNYNSFEVVKRTLINKSFYHAVIFPSGTMAACVLWKEKKTIELFSLPEFIKVENLSGHENDIDALTVSKDGRWIASSDNEGSIFLWKLKKNKMSFIGTKLFSGNGIPFSKLQFSNDNKKLGASGLGGVKYFTLCGGIWQEAKLYFPKVLK